MSVMTSINLKSDSKDHISKLLVMLVVIFEMFIVPGHNPVAQVAAAAALAAAAAAAAEGAGAARAGGRAARHAHGPGRRRRHAAPLVHRGPRGDAGRPAILTTSPHITDFVISITLHLLSD